MFAIKVVNLNKYFRREQKKVIVFEDPREASAFADAFYQYAMGVAMQEAVGFSGVGLVGAAMSAMTNTQVEELPTDFSEPTTTIDELKKK